jgi:hypothetical protein
MRPIISRFYILLLILLLVTTYSCRKLTGQESLRQALEINDTAQQISALKHFIRDYPESKSIDRAYQTIFRDEVALNHEQEALRAAADYLALVPENARMMDYNSMAWTMAEKGLALDSACAYAQRAVRLARETNSRRLNLILDTYAYTLFKTGDVASAEKVQQEAIVGYENDGDFLSRLAEYQHANNEKMAALNTMARAILLNAGSPALNFFNDWLSEEKPQVELRQKLAREIVEQTVTDFLKQNNTVTARSQAAMLLAQSGTDIDRAEKWAAEAVASLDQYASVDDQIMLNKNLAVVYKAKNDYAKMVQILEPWQPLAMPYDQDYWITLALAYKKIGEKEKSFQAVLNGLVMDPNEELRSIAKNQGYTETEIDVATEKLQKDLLAFNSEQVAPEQQETRQVALIELFTGAECPPCVGADKALDLLAEYFPQHTIALLEYHLHIPGPDPLTNTCTEGRYEFYGNNFGVPTIIFGGLTRYTGGGPEIVKKSLFFRYRQAAEKYFTPATGIILTFDTEHRDNLIKLRAEISGLTGQVENPVNLYAALVEKSVDYTGGNGISQHAYVVRSMLNHGDGIPIKSRSGKSIIEETMDLQEVNRELTQYLDNFTQNPPPRYKNFPGWNVRPEKLNPHNLGVVVWIQDEQGKQVYQAGYQDLK